MVIDHSLQTIVFRSQPYNMAQLAERLSRLKALASRTPTLVLPSQLLAIRRSFGANRLLLQRIGTSSSAEAVVGMVNLAVVHLEDVVHLGPICVMRPGRGTPLMWDVIKHIRLHFPHIRRIDLTNRPGHGRIEWYKRFGFIPRTVESGDPTTVLRLHLK